VKPENFAHNSWITGEQSGNDDDGDRAFGTLISAGAVD